MVKTGLVDVGAAVDAGAEAVDVTRGAAATNRPARTDRIHPTLLVGRKPQARTNARVLRVRTRRPHPVTRRQRLRSERWAASPKSVTRCRRRSRRRRRAMEAGLPRRQGVRARPASRHGAVRHDAAGGAVGAAGVAVVVPRWRDKARVQIARQLGAAATRRPPRPRRRRSPLAQSQPPTTPSSSTSRCRSDDAAASARVSQSAGISWRSTSSPKEL